MLCSITICENTNTIHLLVSPRVASWLSPCDRTHESTQLHQEIEENIEGLGAKKASELTEAQGSRWRFEDWMEVSGWIVVDGPIFVDIG